MKKLTAEETLLYLINLFTEYLQEIQAYDPNNEEEYMYGEKTAYIECLEIIQKWNNAMSYGLDYDIEKEFPI